MMKEYDYKEIWQDSCAIMGHHAEEVFTDWLMQLDHSEAEINVLLIDEMRLYYVQSYNRLDGYVGFYDQHHRTDPFIATKVPISIKKPFCDAASPLERTSKSI